MSIRRSVSLPAAACLFVAACALLAVCGTACAQPPAGPGQGPPGRGMRGGGPMLAPEQQAKVWEAESKCVAQDLGLNPDLTKKLADAHKATRESQMTAMRGMIKPGERPDFAAIQEMNKSEQAKFENALKGFLTPEQTTKAAAMLGTFGHRVDSMVAELQSLGLDEKKMNDAVRLVLNYGVESSALLRGAGGGDREALRAKSMEIQQKLDAEMAKVLSADQMAKWKQANEMRGQRRGGPGAPPPPPPPPPAGK